MRVFFKSWRRKIGVLTLVMACVFAAGWVRSFGNYDSLGLNCRPWRYAISSGWGELHFVLAPHDKGGGLIHIGSNNRATKEETFPWNRVITLWQATRFVSVECD